MTQITYTPLIREKNNGILEINKIILLGELEGIS